MSVPGLLAAGPMVTRETRARARSWAAPVVSTSFVCLLLGATLLAFALAVSHAPEHRPDADDMAGAVFVIMAIQFGMLLVLGAGAASAAITRERERDTFDLLLLGRPGPLDLVTGKVLAATAQAVFLVMIAAPVAAAAFLHAGLTLGQLARAEIVTVAAAAAAHGLGVLISARARSTVVATAAATVAMVTLWGGAALAGVSLNPLGALDAIITGGRAAPWLVSAAVQLALAVLFIVLAARALTRRQGSRS